MGSELEIAKEEVFVDGSIDFIVRGEDLDPDEITKNINLEPSVVKRKGELIGKDKRMKDSYWSYQINYEGYDNLKIALEKFLHTLLPFKVFLITFPMSMMFIYFSIYVLT